MGIFNRDSSKWDPCSNPELTPLPHPVMANKIGVNGKMKELKVKAVPQQEEKPNLTEAGPPAEAERGRV